MWSILEIKNKSNVKILKYVEFAFNFGLMFSELEDFLGGEIDAELKNRWCGHTRSTR